MNNEDLQRRRALLAAESRFGLGKISRGEFLSLCAKAGFGFALSASGAFARPASAAPTPSQILASAGAESAIDPLTDQQKFLRSMRSTLGGTTLHIISEDTPPSAVTRALMKQEFVPLTGINVVWEQLPLDRVLAKVIADTALKAGRHDIFYWDQAWIGRFVDDAVDPRELLAKPDLAYPGYDFDDFLPPLVQHVASYKGQLAAIPFDIPVWIMMYRKDIFAKMGLSVPATIPDYLGAVRAINAAHAPNVYGTTEGWKAGHYSLLQKMTTWLWGHGGAFFNRDGTPAINDDKALAGMHYMMELGKCMPPGVTTWDWFGEAKSFARGRAGIYIGIGEFFPGYDDPASSRIVGLAEPAPSPAALSLRPASECGFDETPGMSHHGGSSLAISRYSKHIDAAWVFLQWATSSDVTTRASLLGGGASPIRFSNYDDPRIKEKARVTKGTTRHFDVTRDAIMNHLGTEPHLPDWPTLSIEFAVELGKMTTGQQSIKGTLDNMAAEARRATERQQRAK
jgi:multiple sugar transport system substrate-binding protein